MCEKELLSQQNSSASGKVPQWPADTLTLTSTWVTAACESVTV
jgi:hypothetical protein